MQSYIQAPPYPALPAPFNLAAHVLARAATQPDAIALRVLGAESDTVWRFGEILRAVQGVATGLIGTGCVPGDRILMRLGNSVEFPVLFLACITAGLVPVPTSSMLTAPEVAKLCDLVQPALIVGAPGVALPGAPACPVLSTDAMVAMYDLPAHPFVMGDAGRLAYIIFTSGTSGRPQAVAHAHRAILGRAMMMDGWYGLTSHDRVLHAGAFNWTYTLGSGLMDPWTMGATALIPAAGTKSEDLPMLLARSGATIFAAAPGVYRQMLRHDLPPLPALRHGLSAGEALPPAIAQAWLAATGTAIYEAFGMSEISTFVSGCPARPAPPGSIGFAQAGRHVALLDDGGNPVPRGTAGILAVHKDDPGLFLGYFRDDPATKARFAGDWYVTGDMAEMDADGAIRYLGRNDDMMNAGGYRVSPMEVESAMMQFQGITDCAAIELEVKPGTTIIACIYAAAQPFEPEALSSHANANLARYKQPRAFHHLATLPRNANGKLNRRILRETIANASSLPG